MKMALGDLFKIGRKNESLFDLVGGEDIYCHFELNFWLGKNLDKKIALGLNIDRLLKGDVFGVDNITLCKGVVDQLTALHRLWVFSRNF